MDAGDFDGGQEDLCACPSTYWGYEDEPEHEELYDDEADDDMILEEAFCYADAVARCDDEGWFYED